MRTVKLKPYSNFISISTNPLQTPKRSPAEQTHPSDEGSSTSSLGPWNKSFMDKQTWMERGDDRLSVTLAEIVHIRSVMTKAELEGLPMDVRVKEDVEKRRVCFLCLRTRFSFFGPWGIQCKLCQRTVCAKCYTKVGTGLMVNHRAAYLLFSISSQMRIPSEHFRNVPLVLISPSLLSSPASSSTPSPSHHAQQAHSSSTGNIMDDQFPKSLIERLLRSESDRKVGLLTAVRPVNMELMKLIPLFQTRSTVGSAPSSPKHQRSNMSTPGISVGPGASSSSAAATGQAVEALHDQATMSSSYSAAMRPSGVHQQQKQHYNNAMSRSMEGPRSLPVHSPAYRPLSNNSTLERKWVFCLGCGAPHLLTVIYSQIPLFEGIQPVLLGQPSCPDAGAKGEPARRAGDRVQRLPGTGQRDHELREAEAQLRTEPHHSESHPGSDARLEVGGNQIRDRITPQCVWRP